MTQHFLEHRMKLEDWQSFRLADSHVRRVFPDLLFQQSVNRLEAEVPARMPGAHFASGRSR